MGCICILSTVVGRAGPMPSEAWMSSNYRRTVQGRAPHCLQDRLAAFRWRNELPRMVLTRRRDTRGDKYSTLPGACS